MPEATLKPDLSEQDINPDPKVWPECSTCATAYVLRRCHSFTGGASWLWQRDCKCRKREVRATGPGLADPDA